MFHSATNVQDRNVYKAQFSAVHYSVATQSVWNCLCELSIIVLVVSEYCLFLSGETQIFPGP